MPTTNKIAGESKGRKGKSPRIDLRYKRNSTHEYETDNNHEKRDGNKNERTSMKRMRE